LPSGSFRVTNPSKFNPPADLLTSPTFRFGSRAFFKCTQNPTKTELKNGIYKPRLTLTKRIIRDGVGIFLKIEFSAPKMLYGNNFDEVTEEDFSKLIEKLVAVLANMGIKVFQFTLSHTPVSAIHYSKNIILTDYTSSSLVVKELAKADLGKAWDSTQTKYRNEGHALQFHQNSCEVAFYDKKKDLEQAGISEKKAIEQDNTMQLNLLDVLEGKPSSKPIEVLRFEVRINTKAKLKQLLKRLPLPSEKVFLKDLFTKRLAQNVLKIFLSDLKKSLSFTSIDTSDPIALLDTIIRENRGIRANKALAVIGYHTIANKDGIRALKGKLGQFYKVRSWKSLVKDMARFQPETEGTFQGALQIDKAIDKFLPTRLKDLQNNDDDIR
jgi:hypothetical protein